MGLEPGRRRAVPIRGGFGGGQAAEDDDGGVCECRRYVSQVSCSFVVRVRCGAVLVASGAAREEREG